MRVRDHIAISGAAALLSRRWLGRNALLLWSGAVLIDSDHYLTLREPDRVTAAIETFLTASSPSTSSGR